MKLNQPIPILLKWHNSQIGKWVNQYASGGTVNASWLYGVFCLLPLGLAVLYLNKFWATIVFIIVFVFFLILTILIMAASESPTQKGLHRSLSSQEKQAIINKLENK